MKRHAIWPWLPPGGGDMIAIVVGLLLAAALAYGLIRSPTFLTRTQRPAGFGPDWDCAYTPNSEPICVKRVPSHHPPGGPAQ
jgi:hypothetical protein